MGLLLGEGPWNIRCSGFFCEGLRKNNLGPEVQNTPVWDFPGSPVVKTLHFSEGGDGSIPSQEVKIPHVSMMWPKIKTETPT